VHVPSSATLAAISECLEMSTISKTVNRPRAFPKRVCIIGQYVAMLFTVRIDARVQLITDVVSLNTNGMNSLRHTLDAATIEHHLDCGISAGCGYACECKSIDQAIEFPLGSFMVN
jgi:hypothetical protein